MSLPGPNAPPAASSPSHGLRIVSATSGLRWLSLVVLLSLLVPHSRFRPHDSGQDFSSGPDPILWLFLAPGVLVLMLALRLSKEIRDAGSIRRHPFAVDCQPQAGGLATARSFSRSTLPGFLFLTRDALVFCPSQGSRLDRIAVEAPWEIPLSEITAMEARSRWSWLSWWSPEAMLRLDLRSGETVRITTGRARLWEKLIASARTAPRQA